MILIKKLNQNTVIYVSKLARHCNKCHQYIMPHQKFIQVQKDGIVLNFHENCYKGAKCEKD